MLTSTSTFFKENQIAQATKGSVSDFDSNRDWPENIEQQR